MGGHALGDLAARWQEDVIDLRPDVLSVFVGTNDAERHLGRLLRADDPKTVPDFDFADWKGPIAVCSIRPGRQILR